MSDCPEWHPPVSGSDEPRKVPGRPVFCNDHRNKIRDALNGFESLFEQLYLEASHGTPKPTATGKVSGSHGAPSPAPRVDDADELARWCCELEDSARRRLHAPRMVRIDFSARQRTLIAATQYLSRHLGRILTETEGGYAAAFGQQVIGVDRKLRKKIGWDRFVRRLDVPCPACDMLTLGIADGTDVVRCSSCKNTWPELEYERLALVLASELA